MSITRPANPASPPAILTVSAGWRDNDPAREKALILAVRRGDTEALGVLYGMHRADALSFAGALTQSPHDAEDVFHEAFTKTINAITNGAGPSENFIAYLYAAVRTTAAGWWNRNTREVPLENTYLNHGTLDPRLDAITDKATHEYVIAALQTLPERWQKALWYADVLQEPPRRIAPLMGITPNAVSALVRRARQGLRAAYTEIHTTHDQHGAGTDLGQSQRSGPGV